MVRTTGILSGEITIFGDFVNKFCILFSILQPTCHVVTLINIAKQTNS
jgi:hypothetical protein